MQNESNEVVTDGAGLFLFLTSALTQVTVLHVLTLHICTIFVIHIYVVLIVQNHISLHAMFL